MFHVEHRFINVQDPEAAKKLSELYDSNRQKLDHYVELLLWWNQRINLVSRNVSRETLHKHIQHSLLAGVLGVLNNYEYVIDAGTGGGLPGIPLAICYTEKSFLFNDIVKKKVMAVKAMSRELGLKNGSFFTGSVEELPITREEVLITKHAFKINKLLEMLDEGWREIVMLKGLEFRDELEGVDIPLLFERYDLYTITQDAFYKGKGMVKIRRQNEQQ